MSCNRRLCARLTRALLLCLLAAGTRQYALAQDKPYFVAYSHDLENQGDMDFETKATLGRPEEGNRFGALATEIEYGVRSWWTAGFYLDGQSTLSDSALFTGYRLESRVRPLKHEYVINPVLYVEYADISGADKNMLEVVGHDGEPNLSWPNSVSRLRHLHEGELKLILSSQIGTWNVSENFISEKNMAHDPWEFGYALGIARPLRSGVDRVCTFCPEKLIAGLEAYGGLGNTWALTLHNTAHYIAPTVGWDLPGHVRLNFSPAWGGTGSSVDHCFRIGFVRSFDGIGRVSPPTSRRPVR